MEYKYRDTWGNKQNKQQFWIIELNVVRSIENVVFKAPHCT